jgi:hypothetical protein
MKVIVIKKWQLISIITVLFFFLNSCDRDNKKLIKTNGREVKNFKVLLFRLKMSNYLMEFSFMQRN